MVVNFVGMMLNKGMKNMSCQEIEDCLDELKVFVCIGGDVEGVYVIIEIECD